MDGTTEGEVEDLTRVSGGDEDCGTSEAGVNSVHGKIAYGKASSQAGGLGLGEYSLTLCCEDLGKQYNYLGFSSSIMIL